MNDKINVSKILRQNYLKRKSESKDMSIRWFAKKLQISPTHLSQIINGKRSLSAHLLDPICLALDMDQEQKEVLAAEILKGQGWKGQSTDKVRSSVEAEVTSHKNETWNSVNAKDIVGFNNWWSVAILEVTQLVDYDGSIDYIAKKLGLDYELVSQYVAELKAKDLIVEKSPGKFIKKEQLLEIQSKKNKKSIVEFHSSMMDKSKEIMNNKIADEDYEKRLILSSVFTCSKDQVPLLKLKISEFVRNLSLEAKDSREEEVYNFSVLFFPITESTIEPITKSITDPIHGSIT